MRLFFLPNMPLAIALAVFLFTPQNSRAADKSLTGKQIYENTCAACHGEKGEGTDVYEKALAGDLSVPQLAAQIKKTMPEEGMRGKIPPAVQTVGVRITIGPELADHGLLAPLFIDPGRDVDEHIADGTMKAVRFLVELRFVKQGPDRVFPSLHLLFRQTLIPVRLRHVLPDPIQGIIGPRRTRDIGLAKQDMLVMALIARYHRRASPKPIHEGYNTLERERRIAVMKLAAMLRVAVALDRSYSQRVDEIRIVREKSKLVIVVPDVDDLSLEQLALKQTGSLFEEIFGMPVLLRSVRT